MKSVQLISMMVAAFFLGGCVQSIQPFVKDSQVVYDATLVGTWADADGSTIVVTGDEPSHQYNVTMTEKDGKVGRFIARLGKLQEKMIVDVSPADLEIDHASDTYKAYFLSTHSFLLLDKSPTGLHLTSMDADWLKKYLGEHPDALAHVKPEADRIILTATTDQLQDFVLKHIDTDGAYGKPSELKRVEAPTAKQ